MLRILLLCLLLLLPWPDMAQSYNPATRDTALQHIAALIRDNYVFPDQGNQIADKLLVKAAEGALKPATNWSEFSAAITKLLKTISKDGHMYAGINARIVKELKGLPVTSEEQSDNMPHDENGFNYGIHNVAVFPGNLGYIRVKEIAVDSNSLPWIKASMTLIRKTNALVLDLRGNGGGGSDIGPVWESYFLPARTALLAFHARSGQTKIDSTVTWLNEPQYNKPLFIFVDKGTASAAEALAFSLQQQKRAIIVGQISAGAANMNDWYPVTDSLYLSVSTAAPAIPGSRDNWEQTGVQPDIVTSSGKEFEAVLRELKIKVSPIPECYKMP